MCQIIVKPEGKKFDMRKLDVAQGWNEDGYGVSWWENDELQTFHTMDYNRFKAVLSTLKKHRAVAHLRNTTRGETCLSNNHPFSIPSGVMFHNGTVSSLTCSGSGSDTQELARLINECEYTYIEDILPLIHQIVGDTINRLVFFEYDGKVTIVNEELGQTEDGIWYSNDYHTKTKTRAEATKSVTYGGSDFLVKHRWDKRLQQYVLRDEYAEVLPFTQSNAEEKTRVFVYGTLKEGYSNHNFLLKGAKKIGKATSASKWAMIGEGMSFPYLLRRDAAEGHTIKGEVYEVTKAELEALDRLEGVPTHYKKTFMYVAYEDATIPSENVLVYVKANVTTLDMAKKFISTFEDPRKKKTKA